MRPVTMLTANYDGHEAVQLAIESIVKRTDYPDYKIMVYDSPASGADREYLERQAEQGIIELIGGDIDLNHGQAVCKLLKHCPTEIACIVDSDCEALMPNWLSFLMAELKDDNDIGVARFRPGGLLFPGELLTPYYWLACMVLNVRLYRLIGDDGDWPEKNMPVQAYRGKYVFKPDEIEKAVHVGIDTGGGFTEKILYDNPHGFVMRPIPPGFWDIKFKHYGGISRNHWRPEHPEIAPRWKEIKRRLAALRAE